MILLRVKPCNFYHEVVRYCSTGDLCSAARPRVSACSWTWNLTRLPAVSIPRTAGVAFDGKRPRAEARAPAWGSIWSRNFCLSSSSVQTVLTLKSNYKCTRLHAVSGNLLETHALHLHETCFSTSVRHRGSEEERVSQAYLGESLSRTVQKHDGNRLIYEVRGQGLLRFVTLSFYATAVCGLYLAPDFISSAWENEVLNREAVVNLVAVACAVVGLPASLRLLSKRLVLKLYHNEARETYLAITQSLLLTNKMTTFSLEDVVVKEKTSVFSKMFNLTSFKARRQPFHVNPYNFKLPSDYNHLLGYDRIF